MKNTVSNPIVKSVIERFQTIQYTTQMFVTSNPLRRGLIISGDAGTGKSHYVEEGCIGHYDRIDRRKSESFTAPALYEALWDNRREGDLLILDDCSLESLPSAAWQKWVSWLKGGLETTSAETMVGYNVAMQNPRFREKGIEAQFNFKGSIIWITNTTIASLQKKFGDHWDAIDRRFMTVPVYLTKEEKYMYTTHLINECGMLSNNCSFEGGYTQDIIDRTLQFLSDKYHDLRTITPGLALSIADAFRVYGDMYEIILSNQNIYGNE